jgi:hypothetical protein
MFYSLRQAASILKKSRVMLMVASGFSLRAEYSVSLRRTCKVEEEGQRARAG